MHSGPEPSRHSFDVDPSPQDLGETYLPAFRRTVVEGKAEIVMCAYNAVDGKPACANPELLKDTLAARWGSPGYVTSDCGAIDDITTGHHFTRTNVEAVAAAVKAGTDVGCDFKDEYLDLPKAVAAGLISEGEVDAALKRLLEDALPARACSIRQARCRSMRSPIRTTFGRAQGGRAAGGARIDRAAEERRHPAARARQEDRSDRPDRGVADRPAKAITTGLRSARSCRWME